jgi:hypothetical protein
MSSPENTGARSEKPTYTGELEMTTNITRSLARYIALPIVSAGIIGGAALGMAGMANATTQTQPSGPGYSYAPTVQAHPAPQAQPGWHGHHGVNHIEHLVPGYYR